jgi:hypothetical protein
VDSIGDLPVPKERLGSHNIENIQLWSLLCPLVLAHGGPTEQEDSNWNGGIVVGIGKFPDHE